MYSQKSASHGFMFPLGGIDLQCLDCVFMDAIPVLARQVLHNGKHDSDHDDHAKEAFKAYNLQRSNLHVGHEEVLKCDLSRLHCLYTYQGISR